MLGAVLVDLCLVDSDEYTRVLELDHYCRNPKRCVHSVWCYHVRSLHVTVPKCRSCLEQSMTKVSSGEFRCKLPVMLRSPKYCREASSRPSCHFSCQRIEMRINSSLTSIACWTRVWLCSLIWLRTRLAAASRSRASDFDATTKG